MTNNKNCKLCKRNIGKKLKLFCGLCRNYFHLECGKVSEVDARLMQQEKTSWNCEDCNSEQGSSARSKRTSLMQTFQISQDGAEYNGISELKSMIRELQTDIRDMRQAMEFLNDKYEEERKRSKIMSDMCTEMSKDNQMLKDKVLKLEKAINIQETNKIRNNLSVTGLVKDSKEKDTVVDKMVKLCHYLNVAATKNDFEIIRHFELKNGIKTLIRTSKWDLKNSLLKARAQKGRINGRDVGTADSNDPIFLTEELTQETYILLKKAKELKNVGYKYVWQKNGTVFARKVDGDRYIVIKNELLVNELLGLN